MAGLWAEPWAASMALAWDDTKAGLWAGSSAPDWVEPWAD